MRRIYFTKSPHKVHSKRKTCCCGGHSANDGKKAYKGKQWDKKPK